MNERKKSMALEKVLLRSTLLPALLVIVISGFFDYMFASNTAQETQDVMLVRTAYALASRLSPDEDNETPQELSKHFGADPQQMLRYGQDEIDFLVLDRDGDVLVGSAALMPIARHKSLNDKAPQFSDERLGEKSLRSVLITHRIGHDIYHILVCETRHKKTLTTNKILWNTLWPNLLLVLVIGLVLLHGTRKALRPIQNICDSIDLREPGDSSPIPIKAMPAEIQTLIRAMNRLLEHLSVTQQEQQLFLSGAAHQLRTPLAGIQTQVELAIEESTGCPRQRMERVLDAIRQLSHCSQQMLALARSSSKANTPTDRTSVNLADLAEELGSIWLDTALEKRIELIFDLKPSVVHGERWMLQEMMGNLLDNAIKYSPPHSEVRIRCHTEANHQVCFEVLDSGQGISASDQQRLISPFLRGSHPGIPGSGLGLAIVSEIVKRHGGQLRFVDNAKGLGSLVQVLMPALPKPAGISDSGPG